MQHREELSSAYGQPVRILSGSRLDLRVALELDYNPNSSERIIFVAEDEFPLLDDVAQQVETITLNVQRFFVRYHWATIRHLPIAELQWLYEQRQRVNLGELATRNLVCEYHKSEDYQKNAVIELKKQWAQIADKINFRRPGEWMPRLAKIIQSAIELKGWNELSTEVDELNTRFQDFLQRSYASVVGSALGSKPPKIVTQVAPFIAKQEDARIALIVIDGMNHWQGAMLATALENQVRNASITVDTLFSWLPSVTELSRQALFRGSKPIGSYEQNPHNEQKLWSEFWASRHLPAVNAYYQHTGTITPQTSTTRLGYTNVDLDEKMHSSEDYMYLYDDTKRWIDQSSIIDDIANLIANSFRVLITSDHGNIETIPYRTIAHADKAGADLDNRYITLPEVADLKGFETEYEGHILQIDPESRTYYAKGREIFSTKSGLITHGGTHFLEVLVPFIIITPKQ